MIKSYAFQKHCFDLLKVILVNYDLSDVIKFALAILVVFVLSVLLYFLIGGAIAVGVVVFLTALLYKSAAGWVGICSDLLSDMFSTNNKDNSETLVVTV